MNRQAFNELNGRHCVAAARYFHQRSLRRVCPLPPRFGLCAALVELWWEGGDVLGRLRLPNREMVRDLVVRQSRHAYLTEVPADASLAGEADRALLELKYGTRELRAHPLEADLAKLHGAAVAETCRWTNCTQAPSVDSSEEPGLRLILLRYRDRGHRIAFVAEADGRRRFFDPNAGEVAFVAAADFARWFEDFWQTAGYGRRAPSIALYRFAVGYPQSHGPRGPRVHRPEGRYY